MTLAPGTVHVWRADLDRGPEGDETSLSRTELERTSRFRFDHDRRRWIRCRTLLRELLAGYLDVHPGAIDLSYSPNGKPRLVGEEGIEFNVSHAREVALFAFAVESPVGVDVELLGRVRNPLGAAELVLGPVELERLLRVPEASRESEFLRSWVRYEAALKCRGDRLGAPPSKRVLHLVDLDAGPGAASALALERAPDAVLLRELNAQRIESGPVPT
jgi:4'-phosphopantetheinyl transferase